MQGSDSEAEDGTNEKIAESSLSLSLCLSPSRSLCVSLKMVRMNKLLSPLTLNRKMVRINLG